MELAAAMPWLALAKVEGVGARRFAALVRAFGDPLQVLEASPEQLGAVQGMRRGVAQALSDAGFRWIGRFDQDPDIARDLARAEQCGADIIALGTEEYPDLLAEIYDPPPFLYRLGRRDIPLTPAVSIVGSRRATSYGKLVAERFAVDLAGLGLCIVSGLARGIDGAAHRGALSVHGHTVAVLGCGVDVVYPPEHRRLFEQIAAEGVILSEFAPGTEPEPQHFPGRNRIISGLSLGTVVVEAGERSGALLTADFALDQDRTVFAVPGNITSPMSRGPNGLLREGARVAESARDILEELGFLVKTPRRMGPNAARGVQGTDQAAGKADTENADLEAAGGSPSPPGSPSPLGSPNPPGDAGEERLLRNLGGQPQGVDELVSGSGLSPAEVQAALLVLELKGSIVSLPGPRYIRAI